MATIDDEKRKKILEQGKNKINTAWDKSIQLYQKNLEHAKDPKTKEVYKNAIGLAKLRKEQQLKEFEEKTNSSTHPEGALNQLEDQQLGLKIAEGKNEIENSTIDKLTNIINKLHEKMDQLNTTTEKTHKKVAYLTSNQVIGISFAVGVCASFVGAGIYSIFMNLGP